MTNEDNEQEHSQGDRVVKWKKNNKAFAQVFKSFHRDNRVSHTAYKLYVDLLFYEMGKGSCIPGYERISDGLGVSVATVKRAMKELLELGWIYRVRRYNTSSTTYVFDNREELLDCLDTLITSFEKQLKTMGSNLTSLSEKATWQRSNLTSLMSSKTRLLKKIKDNKIKYLNPDAKNASGGLQKAQTDSIMAEKEQTATREEKEQDKEMLSDLNKNPTLAAQSYVAPQIAPRQTSENDDLSQKSPLVVNLVTRKDKTFTCTFCRSTSRVERQQTCTECGHPVAFYWNDKLVWKDKEEPLPRTQSAQELKEKTAKLHPARRWTQFESLAQRDEWEKLEKTVGIKVFSESIDWALKKDIPRKQIVGSVLSAAVKWTSNDDKKAVGTNGFVKEKSFDEKMRESHQIGKLTITGYEFKGYVDGTRDGCEDRAHRHGFESFNHYAFYVAKRDTDWWWAVTGQDPSAYFEKVVKDCEGFETREQLQAIWDSV